MRKFIVALAVLLGGVSALVAPAGAATATKPVKQVSGTFSGTSSFVLFGSGCSLASQQFDATYKVKKGHGGVGGFHLDGCTDVNFAFSGTASLSAPDGTLLTGTAAGTIGDVPDGAPFDMTLSLSGAAGPVTVHLTGVWMSDMVSGGPISGTITITGL